MGNLRSWCDVLVQPVYIVYIVLLLKKEEEEENEEDEQKRRLEVKTVKVVITDYNAYDGSARTASCPRNNHTRLASSCNELLAVKPPLW